MELNLANKLTLLRVLLIPVFVVVLLTGWVPSPMNRFLAVIILLLPQSQIVLMDRLPEDFIWLLILVSLWIL